MLIAVRILQAASTRTAVVVLSLLIVKFVLRTRYCLQQGDTAAAAAARVQIYGS